MIQRAITAIIGIVIGLFATFAVFSAILGGLDSFYLLTQDACNYGSDNSPKRILRVAPENPEHPRDADEIDWSRDGLDLRHDGSGGCEVAGGFVAGLTYLSPTGDRVKLSASGISTMATTTILTTTEVVRTLDPLLPTEASLGAWVLNMAADALQPASSPEGRNTGLAVHNNDVFTASYDKSGRNLWVARNNRATGMAFTDRLSSAVFASVATPTGGMVMTDDHYWLLHTSQGELRSYSRHSAATGPTIDLTGVVGTVSDLAIHDDIIYALEASRAHAYNITSGQYTLGDTLTVPTGYEGIWIDARGRLWLWDDDSDTVYYQAVYTDPTSATTTIAHTAAGPDPFGDQFAMDDEHWVYIFQDFVNNVVYYTQMTGPQDITYSTSTVHSTSASVSILTIGTLDGVLPWLPAENVFTAQEQLVTLLAVIAAIGMPIGAMTAIVFFGQAVISSGISGQGASQVMVAIAAVVVILVSIQMFQQFAGFLGTAFDAVNGDRFVVFDETLGSLAETIAEFWGVLAFAGFINIASIVWRNYSGNFSIGGTQGGL